METKLFGVHICGFQDSTPGLEFSGSGNTYIQNYVGLFSHIDQCAAAGTSTGNNLVVMSLLFTSTVLCIFVNSFL